MRKRDEVSERPGDGDLVWGDSGITAPPNVTSTRPSMPTTTTAITIRLLRVLMPPRNRQQSFQAGVRT
jgi:hypothetical protein